LHGKNGSLVLVIRLLTYIRYSVYVTNCSLGLSAKISVMQRYSLEYRYFCVIIAIVYNSANVKKSLMEFKYCNKSEPSCRPKSGA
jgi:hypothetical protein